MPDGIKMTLTGMDKEIKRMSRALNPAQQEKVRKSAIKGAAAAVVKVARTKVPTETGTLKKSIGQRARNYKRTRTSIVVVGPRTKFTVVDDQGRERHATKYAHLVEFGTINTRPKPFMRPAASAGSAQASKGLQRARSTLQRVLAKG